MKSGVQLNFFERRALADRALSRLVELAREETEKMTSREQRGVYQLEATLVEKASDPLPVVRVWIDPMWLARWHALSASVLAYTRELWRATLARWSVTRARWRR
ncbi:MAG: hypothetical protein ABW133_25445 [Polyangiaceae bacterium]